MNFGTEATMSAIRLARGYTGRDKIIKFAGNYHGHSDGLLVKAGSGCLTGAFPDSLGVPASYAEQTLVAQYNDPQSVRELFDANPGQIACVILEPVAANMRTWQCSWQVVLDVLGIAQKQHRPAAQHRHHAGSGSFRQCLSRFFGGEGAGVVIVSLL